MILDKNSDLTSGTVALGVVGTMQVGDSIDLGADSALDDHVGEELYAIVLVDTTADSVGHAATARFLLVSDAQDPIATDGSATVHAATGAIAEADLVLGTLVLGIKLPAGVYERYLGILETTAGEDFTLGKVQAFLTKDVSKWIALTNAVVG